MMCHLSSQSLLEHSILGGEGEEQGSPLLDAMPLIVWIARSDGSATYFNQHWLKVTGMTLADSLDWGWQQALHPDDGARCLQVWQAAVTTGEPYEMEYRFRQAAGGYRWYLGRGLPMRDRSTGQITAWVGTATDIQEQKQAEETEHFLAEASRELANSLDYAVTLSRIAQLAVPRVADWCAVDVVETAQGIKRLVVAHVDPQKVAWANDLQERYPPHPEEAYGVPNVLRTGQSELYPRIQDELLVAVAQDEEHLQLLRQVGFTSAMVVPLKARGRILGAMTFVAAESGRQYTPADLELAENLAHRSALALDSALLFQAAHQELQERQRIEAALRESELRFRLMADSAPVLLWVSDTSTKCTFFNQVWLEFTGRSLEQELGHGWIEGVHPEDHSQCLDIYVSSFAARQPFEMEYRLQRQDGEYRWLLNKAIPRYLPDGTFAGYIGSGIDITERQETEAALRSRATDLAAVNTLLAQTMSILKKRNQELDQFAYVISHDLKAPLRAIASLSEWIEDDLSEVLTPDTRHQMDLLRRRVHRMEGLIEGLLQYSRVGRVSTPTESVSVSQLLADVVDSLSPPPEFQVIIAPNLPTLTTSRLQLQQVFANLISNAIKHHVHSDGSVHIRSQDLGDVYEFSVSDNGPGIAPQFHERIFAIFQTLKSRDEAENTGIGLSLVKKIVEGQGGSISVESEAGQGATFRFTWPKVPPDRD